MEKILKPQVDTYVPANFPYWFRLETDSKPRIVTLKDSKFANKEVSVHKAEMLNQLGFDCAAKQNSYNVYADDNLLVTSPIEKHFIDFSSGKRDAEMLLAYGQAQAHLFRSETKTRLLKALSNSAGPNSTDTVLGAFKDYAFFDGYSAWLYNEYTDTFTRIAGDFDSSISYKKTSECKILKHLLTNPQSFICEKTERAGLPDETNASFTYLNAFSVSVTGEESGLRRVFGSMTSGAD